MRYSACMGVGLSLLGACNSPQTTGTVSSQPSKWPDAGAMIARFFQDNPLEKTDFTIRVPQTTIWTGKKEFRFPSTGDAMDLPESRAFMRAIRDHSGQAVMPPQWLPGEDYGAAVRIICRMLLNGPQYALVIDFDPLGFQVGCGFTRMENPELALMIRRWLVTWYCKEVGLAPEYLHLDLPTERAAGLLIWWVPDQEVEAWRKEYQALEVPTVKMKGDSR